MPPSYGVCKLPAEAKSTCSPSAEKEGWCFFPEKTQTNKQKTTLWNLPFHWCSFKDDFCKHELSPINIISAWSGLTEVDIIYLQSFNVMLTLKPNHLMLMSLLHCLPAPYAGKISGGSGLIHSCRDGWQQTGGHCGGFLMGRSSNFCPQLSSYVRQHLITK